MAPDRQTTGVPGLDDLLGGGLIPGTLSVIIGATGIGKTQMGVHYAHAGIEHEGHGGVFFDMCSRGDSQNHANYAKRMKDWELEFAQIEPHIDFDAFLAARTITFISGVLILTRFNLPFLDMYRLKY